MASAPPFFHATGTAFHAMSDFSFDFTFPDASDMASITTDVILRVSWRRPELLAYLRPTAKEHCQCYACHIG